MKKLALSLVLTLGVSGVVLANNGNGEKEKQPVKKEKTDKVDDCLVKHIYPVEGLCGEVEGQISYTETLSGDACKGANGGVLFQNHHALLVNDCW